VDPQFLKGYHGVAAPVQSAAHFAESQSDTMDPKEIFSQSRMERCANIQRAILENWQRTASAPYTVQATESVAGLTLTELRLQYFAVGAAAELTEIPFHDMLVVFVMLEETTTAMRKRDKTAPATTIHFKFSTVFPDDEVRRLLTKIRIETPFDQSPYLSVPTS
jgi:hypothetical protein